MSDNPEDFSPGELAASSDPGDAPVDFPHIPAETAEGPGGPSDAIPLGAPRSSYTPPAVPPPDERPGAPVFPIVMMLLFGGLVAVAWFISRQPTPPPAPAPATPAAAPAPAPGDTLAADFKDLKSRVDSLADQIKGLEGKVASLPKPEGAPDLKPVQGKLDELSRSVAAVTPLSDQVGKLGDRISEVDGSIKAVKGELDDLKGQVKTLAAAPASTPAPATAAAPAAATPAPAGGPAEGEALTQGATLFKAGKYKESSDVLSKLVADNPKDARAYYYAALARGAATNEWTGETLDLVNKGIELEKSGSPKAAEIDSAFADLPAQLKPWLAAYRKRAR